ncbi:DEAD/DEAH box helicase family protein, partial [Escherichia coli]
MNLGGSTYYHMLDKLLPILDEAKIDIELEDHRVNYGFNFEPIDEDIFSDVVFGAGHHMEGKSIKLREHQVNAVNACLANPHGLLLAATGAGKTLITAALSKKVQEYGRSVIIVP